MLCVQKCKFLIIGVRISSYSKNIIVDEYVIKEPQLNVCIYDIWHPDGRDVESC